MLFNDDEIDKLADAYAYGFIKVLKFLDDHGEEEMKNDLIAFIELVDKAIGDDDNME